MQNLNAVFKELREYLGLTIEQATVELGTYQDRLLEIEDGTRQVTEGTLEQVQAAWHIDLYMFAVAFGARSENYPEGMRKSADALAEAWREHIERIRSERKPAT